MVDQSKANLYVFICKLCPLCIAARRWPNSVFAQKMKRLDKFCPFCKAYKRLKGK